MAPLGSFLFFEPASGYRDMVVTPSYPLPQQHVPTLGALQPAFRAVDGTTLTGRHVAAVDTPTVPRKCL